MSVSSKNSSPHRLLQEMDESDLHHPFHREHQGSRQWPAGKTHCPCSRAPIGWPNFAYVVRHHHERCLTRWLERADSRMALGPLSGNALTPQSSLYADDLVVLVAPIANNMHCLRKSSTSLCTHCATWRGWSGSWTFHAVCGLGRALITTSKNSVTILSISSSLRLDCSVLGSFLPDCCCGLNFFSLLMKHEILLFTGKRKILSRVAFI